MTITDDALKAINQLFDHSINYQNIFRALLTPMSRTEDMADRLLDSRDIDSGNGVWLDNCGNVVGADRLPHETPVEQLFAFGTVAEGTLSEVTSLSHIVDLDTGDDTQTIIDHGDYIYILPDNSTSIYAYNKLTEGLSNLGSIASGTGPLISGATVGTDGHIYLAPHGTSRFYRINTTSVSVENLGPSVGTYSGCHTSVSSSTVFFIPENASHVVSYDISTSTFDLAVYEATGLKSVYVQSFDSILCAPYYSGGDEIIMTLGSDVLDLTSGITEQLLPGALITTPYPTLYFIGKDADTYFYKVPFNTMTLEQVGASFSAVKNAGLSAAGTEQVGNYMLVIPYELDTLLVFNTGDGTWVSGISSPVYPNPRISSFTVFNDRIYGYSDTYNDIIIYDYSSGVSSITESALGLSASLSANHKLSKVTSDVLYVIQSSINIASTSIDSPPFPLVGFSDLGETTGGFFFSYQGNYITGTSVDDDEYRNFVVAKALANFRGSSLRDIVDFVFNAVGDNCFVSFADQSDVEIAFDNPNLDYSKKRIVERYAPITVGSKIIMDYDI